MTFLISLVAAKAAKATQTPPAIHIDFFIFNFSFGRRKAVYHAVNTGFVDERFPSRGYARGLPVGAFRSRLPSVRDRKPEQGVSGRVNRGESGGVALVA